uniref:Cytochrome P450 n=1 Tax=Cucumis sativus TaxID=3659 RepID=A0A0A0LZU6_CUCSA
MKNALNVLGKYDERIIKERVQQWKNDKKIKGVEDILDILISLEDDDGNSLLSIEEIKTQIMVSVLQFCIR